MNVYYPLPLSEVTEWPASPGRSDHTGTDFKAPVGTVVPAAFDGVVTYVGDDGLGGMTVDITNKDGLTARYGHLSKYLVSYGDHVSALDIIALSGNTGRSTGPHIHFELRYDRLWNGGAWVDPRRIGAVEPYKVNNREKTMIVNMQGKAGSRRGGAYYINGGKAVFIGPSVAGAPTLGEGNIANMQALVEGLR